MTKLGGVTTLLSFLSLVTPTMASAQVGARPYVSVAVSTALRDSAASSLTVTHAPRRSFVPVLAVSGGVRLTPWIGVEGALQWQGAQTFPWQFLYTFVTEELATERDSPLVGYVRFSPCGTRSVCVEPVIGAGLSWHASESRTTGDCGSFPSRACTAVNPPSLSDTLTTREWLFATGADVPVRLGAGVSIAPSMRVMWMRRRQDLTGYRHRGPGTGSGVVAMFGLAATWAAR